MANHADQVPAARIVRQGSVVVPLPRRSLRHRLGATIETVAPALRNVGLHVVGLWPIWAVAALAISLLWVAGLLGSP